MKFAIAFANTGPAVDPKYSLICLNKCAVVPPTTPPTFDCDQESFNLSGTSVTYSTCKCAGTSVPTCCHGGVVYVDGDAFSPATQGLCGAANGCRAGICQSYNTSADTIGAKCQN